MRRSGSGPKLSRASWAAFALGLGFVAVFFAADAAAHAASAQARNPFDLGMREGGPLPSSGVAVWILSQQIRFERMLSGAVRAVTQDAAAFWTLAGLSFAYGVFHAAGPGHGKAVVASYMFANERSLRRGVAISFLAALLQALVAVSIVGFLALALNATSARMREAANLVEIASYAGVAALGAWLLWRKGRAFARERTAAQVAALEKQAQPGRFRCEAAEPGHVHDASCGHVHAPAPEALGDGFTWKGAAGTIFAARARPCSGAILVLVFSLAQGVFIAGVAAALAMALGVALTTGALAATAVLAKGLAVRLSGAGSPRGALLVRGLELAAALAILLLGVSLLLGALAGR